MQPCVIHAYSKAAIPRGWRVIGERGRWWLGHRFLRRADLVIARRKPLPEVPAMSWTSVQTA